jgi:hypothetical protein
MILVLLVLLGALSLDAQQYRASRAGGPRSNEEFRRKDAYR